MSGGWAGSVGGPEGVVGQVTRTAETVRELGKPTGAQIYQTIKEVRSLVEGLSARVDTLIQDQSYTKQQIDDKVASRAPLVHTHPQEDVTGVWDKDVDNTGEVRTANVYASAAPTYNITGSRVASWLETATGRVGTASSSERYKNNIHAIEDLDPELILGIVPVYYQWIADLKERERRAALPPTDPAYHPDLKCRVEAGMIAERLHEAGLWPFVIYQRKADGTLTIDRDGEAIPEGIHYALWGVAQQLVVRYLDKRVKSLEKAAQGRLSQEFTSAPLASFTLGTMSRDVDVTWPVPFVDDKYMVAVSVEPPAGVGTVATGRVIAGSKTTKGCKVRVRTTGVALGSGMVVLAEAIHP